jgi:hypothetical protein
MVLQFAAVPGLRLLLEFSPAALSYHCAVTLLYVCKLLQVVRGYEAVLTDFGSAAAGGAWL